MSLKPCLFCEIVKKTIQSHIVYEDNSSLAFLDINPRSKGMTVVVPKEHLESFDKNIELSSKVFQTAEMVALMIKKTLSPLFVDFSIIPSVEVPHFHIRLYPVYEEDIPQNVPLIENKPIRTSVEELEDTAEKIRSEVVELEVEKKEEPKIEEEKPKEKKRSPKDIRAIKRELARTI